MAHLTDHVDLATPFAINNKQSVILIRMANYITDMMKMVMITKELKYDFI